MRVVSYESEVLGLCQALVRIKSLSGREGALAELVIREMGLLGYDRVDCDTLGSVTGVVEGAQPGRTLLIDAHMDVVPVTTPQAWTHPPFSGEYADGMIWGRGSVDVKGSLAAAMVAVGALPRDRLAGQVVLAASVGEEMIEGAALRPILERYRPDAVVICEPTGLCLGLGHKGRAGIVVEAYGVAAHSSTPERGMNAIYRMLEAVERIRRIPPRRDPLLGSGVNELIEIISDPYPAPSMVPQGCRARFDRRLVRGETLQGVMDEMREALDGLDGVDVRYHLSTLETYTGCSLAVDDYHPAWAMDAESGIVQRALVGLAEAGQEPRTWLAPYCTNGATSAGEMGVPTLIYGAGEISRAHAVDEAVEACQLQAAYRGYRALALALTRAV